MRRLLLWLHIQYTSCMYIVHVMAWYTHIESMHFHLYFSKQEICTFQQGHLHLYQMPHMHVYTEVYVHFTKNNYAWYIALQSNLLKLESTRDFWASWLLSFLIDNKYCRRVIVDFTTACFYEIYTMVLGKHQSESCLLLTVWLIYKCYTQYVVDTIFQKSIQRV